MKPTHRHYRKEYDYHKIREFLTQTLLLNQRKQINWHLYRWDYWRWHVSANIHHFKFEDVVHLWETEDCALAAVLNPQDPGDAFLQVHPRHRTQGLVCEMLDVAEENLSVNRSLNVWAHEQDEVLRQALVQRGYTKQELMEYQHWQTLEHSVLIPSLPEGYKIDVVHADADLPTRSWASWRAFHPIVPQCWDPVLRTSSNPSPTCHDPKPCLPMVGYGTYRDFSWHNMGHLWEEEGSQLILFVIDVLFMSTGFSGFQ